MRIAALDDEPCQIELIRHAINAVGHECHGFEDGMSLLRALREQTYDLLIIDWQLPDVQGPDVVKWLREELGSRLPVLFVTNRRKEEDMVEALTAGADDFMIKPLRVGELTARVKALLRRAYHQQPPNEVSFGRYRFDVAGAQITVDGVPVTLKQKEFDLALFLFQNIGRLLSRKHLLEAVWAIEAEVSSRSLDTHISRLRTKLGLHPENGYRLAAIYSVGYRLETVGTNGLAVASADEPTGSTELAAPVADGPPAD